MKKSLRPSNSTQDIIESLKAAFVSMILIAMIFGLGILICYACLQRAYNNYESHSIFATVANEKLDIDQRAALAPVVSEISDDDFELNEDGLFVEREKPKMFEDVAREVWWIILIIYLCICSVATSICYTVKHDKDYYLADLPLRSAWGWCLLISIFMAWPILLVSRILMLREKKTNTAKAKVAKRLSLVEPVFDESAFVEFYYDMSPIEKQIEDAEDFVRSSESDVERYATLLKNAQRELSEEKAKLNALKSQKEFANNDNQVKEQVMNDFMQIKEMHGVQQIYVKNDCLFIRVRTDYMYKNILYDLGDYEIKIDKDGPFSARMIRSNIKGCEGYSIYGTRNFCFGDRQYEIRDYLSQGRLIEAIELIIECLNYVNACDREALPDRYEAVYMSSIKKEKYKHSLHLGRKAGVLLCKNE